MESLTERVRQLEAALALAEDRFFAHFDTAPCGVISSTAEGRVLRANPRFCQMLGYTAAELAERTIQELTHPDDRAATGAQMARVLSGETPVALEKRYLHRDGSVVWASVNASATRDEAGKPAGFMAMVVDITERRRAQDALERREAEFRTLVANLPDIVTRIDPELRYLYVNPAITRVSGRAPEEFIGRTHRELGYPEASIREWEEKLSRGLRDGQPYETDWEVRAPDGTPLCYHVCVVPERDGEGNVVSLLGISRDVTDARRLERMITAEERYQALVEATSAAVWRAGADGLFSGPQPSWEALTGQSTGEVQGIGWLAAVHPDDRRHTLEAWTRAVADRTPYEVEHRVRTVLGEWRPMHARAAPVFGPDGRVREWVGTEADISDRRRAEQTVRFQASLLAAVDQAVVATDLSGRVTYWNGPAERLLGWSADEMAGRDLRSVLADAAWPGDPSALLTRLQSGGGWTGEMEVRRRDGSAFDALVSAAAVRNEAGALTGVVRVVTDVSALKEAPRPLVFPLPPLPARAPAPAP